MADVTLRELSQIIHTKALELSSRASALADHATTDGEVEFVLAIIDESLSSLNFRVDDLKRAARK